MSNSEASSSMAAAAGSIEVDVPEVSATEMEETVQKKAKEMMDLSDMVDVDMMKADHSACLLL